MSPFAGLSDGEIAGIVIGTILGVLLLVAGAFFGYKQYKKMQRKKALKKRQRQEQQRREQEERQEYAHEKGMENPAVADIDLRSDKSSDA